MNSLNKIVTYWYDCIRNEDILEKDISIHVRSKAVLYPFEEDPFIFERKDNLVSVSKNEKLSNFSDYITTRGYEPYYGYPILFYFDDEVERYLIAPLFIIKVKFVRKNSGLFLQKDEQIPTCGIQAFDRLGLRTEEIADISQEIEKIFKTNLSNSLHLVEKCLEAIQVETEIPIIESIIPSQLTNLERLSKNMPPGLYNKSLVFAGENTVYNINLLQDLLELKTKEDLEKTALSFITNEVIKKRGDEIIPVLPFPSNEYQIKALQDIFQNELSVITGPPGTGKSQFISNLLINLFLKGKSVLFVSHTNKAVEVVDEKINDHFKNLMMRTGKKEFRQELKGKFNELIFMSKNKRMKHVSYKDITWIWDKILRYRDFLFRLDSLEEEFENLYFKYTHDELSSLRSNLFSRLAFSIKKLFRSLKLTLLKRKLNFLPRKLETENKIRDLEKKFYETSDRYIRHTYINKLIGSGENIGAINSFLSHLDSDRSDIFSIDNYLFRKAQDSLKIWASTLKSLRRTFPLEPGIFDFVIFDEASQVDLPSAAPALYRAEKAIIVGDPMQLTHVAGITWDIDKGIAKIHGLSDEKDFYPSKTRYCDVSLYKCAENSLSFKPILLTNHYRSEDQIIALCNKAFYEERLKIMTTLDYSQFPNNLPLGIHWIDCRGEVNKHPGGSRINKKEVESVKEAFHDILSKVAGTNLSIGVVTPYSRQEGAITKRIIETTPNYSELKEKHDIEVLTAHKFQGTEKDIMIFSSVLASRGNGNSDRWYNIYPQILNVALSRARYLLYIVGDRKFYFDHSCYKGEDCTLKRVLRTYDDIKKQEKFEEYTLHQKFDSPTERYLFEELQKIDFANMGYKLIPKLVVKRYTLDFVLFGNKKIDIECDGCQHEIIEGFPIIEDVERDEFLKKEGWKILRFPNHEILDQTDNVVEQILTFIET